MEKFLWNLVGALLILCEAMAFIYALLSQTPVSCVFLIVISVLGFIYADKRPRWLEV
jgi:hypothetical protein